VRRFWKGDAGMLSDFAYRLTGSSDLYQSDGRKPYASINFITAHDGFTLNDLVSYDHKHNEANKEGNRDGSDSNDSWNMGAEGATDNKCIRRMRERQMRNFLATLMFSQGVPMLTGGDEVARTQNGNNNAYCQDNELSWFDWERCEEQARLLSFTSRIIQLRLAHPNLRRRRFFQDRVIRTPAGGKPVKIVKDIAWFSPDGNEVPDDVWGSEWIRSIALLLNGQTLQVANENGEWVLDHSFLLLVNASHEGVRFNLPPSPTGNAWVQIVDTENIEDPFVESVITEEVILGGRSLKLFNDALPVHAPDSRGIERVYA